MTAETAKPKVFISYSRKDVAWKERVLEQLRVLEFAGELIVWDDERINAGNEWLKDIEAAMSSAEVAVLLISADFLTSPFIRRSEIPRLLDRRQTEGLRVIPLFVRPCAWKTVGWLAALQGRPSNGKALSELRRHQSENELAGLALEIGTILAQHSKGFPPVKAQPDTNFSQVAAQVGERKIAKPMNLRKIFLSMSHKVERSEEIKALIRGRAEKLGFQLVHYQDNLPIAIGFAMQECSGFVQILAREGNNRWLAAEYFGAVLFNLPRMRLANIEYSNSARQQLAIDAGQPVFLFDGQGNLEQELGDMLDHFFGALATPAEQRLRREIAPGS